MSKETGISETFDEHEVDTAQRAYPQGVVEGAKRTTKMSAVNLEQVLLRSESGTQPAITHASIAAHARANLERIEDAFNASVALSGNDRISGTSDPDPHARPTIEAGLAPLADLTAMRTPAMGFPVSLAPSSTPEIAEPLVEAPLPQKISSQLEPMVLPISIGRSTFAFLVLVVIALIAGAGIVGFRLGLSRSHLPPARI